MGGALYHNNRHGFLKAVHQVEILHGGAGGALHEVIDRTDYHDAAADAAHGKVAKIRAGDVLRAWEARGETLTNGSSA